MTRARFSAALLFSAAIFSSGIQAQTAEKSTNGGNGANSPANSLIKPGRDPMQPIDSEYTKKIREYTTEPFFISPLVD
jgi:hypothetical protein